MKPAKYGGELTWSGKGSNSWATTCTHHV